MSKTTILAEARGLFSREGYDATSMEKIARRVGIRKASLYAHHPGKEALFREVFASVLSEYSLHLEKVEEIRTSAAPIRERLTALFAHYVSYFSDAATMAFWYRIYMAPPAFMKEEILGRTIEVETRFIAKITQLFQDGMKTGELQRQNAERVSMTFYQILMGFGMTIAFYPVKSVQKSIRECLDVFWRGIGPSADGTE